MIQVFFSPLAVVNIWDDPCLVVVTDAPGFRTISLIATFSVSRAIFRDFLNVKSPIQIFLKKLPDLATIKSDIGSKYLKSTKLLLEIIRGTIDKTYLKILTHISTGNPGRTWKVAERIENIVVDAR